MLEVLAVCTGNICRSPLAEKLLARDLSASQIRVASAGTHARPGMSPTAETVAIAAKLGFAPENVTGHKTQLLTAPLLGKSDLVLAMAREHRRQVVELNPSLLSRTFTIRELSRLLADVSDAELSAAAAQQSTAFEPTERLTRMLALVASRRGIVLPPVAAEDDDVVDPYGRSLKTYDRSAAQLLAALPAVLRLLRFAADEEYAVRG